MTRSIRIAPLTPEAFAPFGDIIEATGQPTMMINRGNCGRYHDLAKLDFAGDGRAAISLFECKSYELPLQLDMVERHPLGSQAFLPMSEHPFLVVVAPDEGGRPGRPSAFLTRPHQGINLHIGTWHGVLTPLAGGTQYFAVVDRVGGGENLEEYWFETPYVVS